MIALKEKNTEELNKTHMNIAKRVQGLLPNTPHIVPLVSLRWIRLSTYMEKEAMHFFWNIMCLPMESIYKQILISRIVDLEASHSVLRGKGPTESMLRIIDKYGLRGDVRKAISTGAIMTLDQWKHMVKEKVMQKEHHEWKATCYMYRSSNEFKALDVNIKHGWGWWQIARWDCSLLKKIKYMWTVLHTNNAKSGHNCTCEDLPTMAHVLFECELIHDTRGHLWTQVVNVMPHAMTASINSMTGEEKVVFIYSCFHGAPLCEWMGIYRAMSVYVSVLCDEWYKKVKVEISDDGG
jgi:hypothetical protein